MGETYTKVSLISSLPVIAIMMIVPVILLVGLRKRAIWPPFWLYILFALFVLSPFANFPVAATGLLYIALAVPLAWLSRTDLKMRTISSAMFGAGFFALLSAILGSHSAIVLSNREVAGGDSPLPRSAVRDTLKITEVDSADWRTWPYRWSFWIVGNGYDHDVTFSGNDVYWGPRGFIRGDQLGQRIAEWAGAPIDRPQERAKALAMNR